MKIAILSPVAWRTPPRHYGPWEQVASNVAEGLVEKGVDVTLFATEDSMTQGKLASIVPIGYEDDKNTDAKVAECMHISYLMERADEFDLIHNHFDFLPLTYSPLIHTPMITTIHGFSSPKIIQVYKRFNNINAYVSISQSDRSPELKYAATIYHGLDPKNFPYHPVSGEFLLFFGRIHPDKGAWEAIQIALQSGRRLILAGIIQDEVYFTQKIKPLLDGNQINYIGTADPTMRQQLLGEACCLLHPIHFEEPFGLSVAEAMMCGTPVIAFNRGSMPELIKSGETGFIVNNVAEAVDKIKPAMALNRSACRAWALARFSREKMVSDYMKVYERVCDAYKTPKWPEGNWILN